MFHCKRLVDTLMIDYGIQNMKPLPSPKSHPHSPFSFASAPEPIVNNETKPSAYIYRNIWDVV